MVPLLGVRAQRELFYLRLIAPDGGVAATEFAELQRLVLIQEVFERVDIAQLIDSGAKWLPWLHDKSCYRIAHLSGSWQRDLKDASQCTHIAQQESHRLIAVANLIAVEQVKIGGQIATV